MILDIRILVNMLWSDTLQEIVCPFCLSSSPDLPVESTILLQQLSFEVAPRPRGKVL